MSATLDLVIPRVVQSYKVLPSEVLFISECTPWGKLGYETVSAAFGSVQPIYWSPGMPKPDLSGWEGDWIISFKSDLILSGSTIQRAKKGAVNFHPNPPKYRGVGGYWWAIQNGDSNFGITCHHMDERIDHGAIIATENFPIWPGETEASLRHRAAVYSLGLLSETLNKILSGNFLTASGEKWEQHLYTYQELELAQQKQKLSNAKPALAALESVLKEASTAVPQFAAKTMVAKKRRAG